MPVIDERTELTPLRAFDVQMAVVDREPYIVRGRDAFELSEVGTFIWRRCDGRTPVHAIADAIATEYDIDRETALEDALEFLDAVHGERLIEGWRG